MYGSENRSGFTLPRMLMEQEESKWREGWEVNIEKTTTEDVF